MDKGLELFINLSNIFKEQGFNLYLVGGSVRDYLLKIPLVDLDCATDATPNQIKEFLPDCDFSFMKMGSVRCNYQNEKFDITTFRKESEYIDFRHPNKIEFVNDLKIDSMRRDFTINAMYLDKDLNLYDFYNGQKDLNNKLLKMVGEPNKRLKEDPLRIIRAIRFSLMFDLTFDESLVEAIKNNVQYLNYLNKDKIKQDLNKLDPFLEERKKQLLNYFNINI